MTKEYRYYVSILTSQRINVSCVDRNQSKSVSFMSIQNMGVDKQIKLTYGVKDPDASIEKTYDLYIPINKKIGTVKGLIEESLVELTDKAYEIREDTNFFSKETGEIYNVNSTVVDTDLENGSRIILM